MRHAISSKRSTKAHRSWREATDAEKNNWITANNIGSLFSGDAPTKQWVVWQLKDQISGMKNLPPKINFYFSDYLTRFTHLNICQPTIWSSLNPTEYKILQKWPGVNSDAPPSGLVWGCVDTLAASKHPTPHTKDLTSTVYFTWDRPPSILITFATGHSMAWIKTHPPK